MKNIEVIASLAQPEIITDDYFFDKDAGYGKANNYCTAGHWCNKVH